MGYEVKAVSPSKEEVNTRVVRTLWAASRRGGTGAALELLQPDAEWRLHIYPDRILTSAEFAETMDRIEHDRQVTNSRLTQLEAHGDFVVAAGSFRWTGDDGGITDFRGYWLYECLNGRIVRGQSFPDWNDAQAEFGRSVAEAAL
jgi:ketosteroid isomerase-like protein